MNEDDAALQSFGRAIEVEPAFADAYGNRATLLSEMGRREDAVADFDRALALRAEQRRRTSATGRARWPISAGSTRRWRA